MPLAQSGNSALPGTTSAASLPAHFWGGSRGRSAGQGRIEHRVTNETDTFVQEVDEKLREERLKSAAKRYGPWVGGAVLAFLLGVAGWQFWTEYSLTQSRDHSDSYVAAQGLARANNLDAAKEAFAELRDQGPRPYRVMAMLEHAALLSEQGDLEASLAEFDRAAEAASDRTMRDTARLRAAFIAAEIQEFDAVRARLQPLIDSDSRLAFLARELLGVEAWEAGELDLARTTFEGLTLAFDAPDAVRERAQIALSVIGPPAEASAAPAPAAPSEGETE